MKRIVNSILMLLLSLTAAAQSWTADNGNGTYTNPLFYDEFSDPDIIRVGNDYYLAGTTMHCLPGVVILHSTDLVNWEFMSYCMDKFDLGEEFRLENGKEAYGQGIWAPCIRYHNGKFYVFSNINGHGMQVFIADNPKGPWERRKMGGHIYDLSVLFDDDGKIYAIHQYGTVKVTEIKPDFSGYVEGSERVIIPEGSAMGEGHHVYKINGYYYILSADYSPMGRMQCARSKSLFGPYETCAISVKESLGMEIGTLQHNVSLYAPMPEKGKKFNVSGSGGNRLGCATMHQGGIVDTPNGEWWGLSMMDHRAVGRTTCLSPITWVDGWPYFGLPGNLGRSPRTWYKPLTSHPSPLTSPYDRNDDFSGKTLKPVWQWNHEPLDGKWKLAGGKLRINAMPAKDFFFARNTLTQRAIGPTSVVTVSVDATKLKDGDIAGLGILNMPCAWLGIVAEGKELKLRWYEQLNEKTIDTPLSTAKLLMRLTCDLDADVAQLSYSTDGKQFTDIGGTIILPYQLKTFQGSRNSLFAFNSKGKAGGYAEFDDFTVDEPLADRSNNLPIGKVITLTNLGNGERMFAFRHGLIHTRGKGSKEYDTDNCRFLVEDRGQGRVVLKAMNGMGYVTVVGAGLSADVRLIKEESKASLIMWQDMLRNQCMLLSLKTNRYIGLDPTTGEPYSADWQGASPNRRNGVVFSWEEVK